MPKFIYFGLAWAVREHDSVLSLTGGLPGVRDLDQLAGVLEFIRNDDYYPDFEAKLSYLVYTVAMGHFFSDGNKRSSIALGAYFLTINGREDVVNTFIVAMENPVLWIASRYIERDLLEIIIRDVVTAGAIQDETKLRVIQALNSTNHR